MQHTMQTLKHSYSEKIYNKRIGILGNMPPPLGGVAVHVSRVFARFEKQNNRVFHFDTSKRTTNSGYLFRLLSFLFFKRCDIIFYHTIDLNRRLLECKVLIFCKKILRYQLIIVEHNCRYLFLKNVSYKKTYNKCLRSIDKIVYIGHSTWQSYIKNGIMVPPGSTIESAFLPPQDLSDDSSYPQDVKLFMVHRSPLLLINAFQLSMLNGKDLYGIDSAIKMIQMLKLHYPNIGLVCAFSQIGDQRYFAQLQQKIINFGTQDHVYFLVGQHQLWPLLKKSDVFLRPTLSDGDSVSVQEALYFNIPVVASNAVIRPKNVHTFKTGNEKDFHAKLLRILYDQTTIHKHQLGDGAYSNKDISHE